MFLMRWWKKTIESEKRLLFRGIGDMNISTLEQVRKDMEHGVYDKTDNGKCTQCGACCSNLLPMTDKEITVIRNYIKKHHIKECNHSIPLAKPAIDMTCPFLDTSKRTEKCTIYSVRPVICKCFLCSEPNGMLKHKKLLRGIRKPVYVRETFYGSEV